MMTNEQLEKAIQDLQKENTNLRQDVSLLKSGLTSARVVIKNFEGALKIATAIPTTDDTQEGSLTLVNDGVTYSLSARINNGWRSVTLT